MSERCPADPEIIEGLPIPLAVAGHHQPAPFYLTADMFGGLPVQLAGGELSAMVGKPVAAPHTHPVDELYLLVSPNKGAPASRSCSTADGTNWSRPP